MLALELQASVTICVLINNNYMYSKYIATRVLDKRLCSGLALLTEQAEISEVSVIGAPVENRTV